MKTKLNAIPAFNICCHTKTSRFLFALFISGLLFFNSCSQDKTPCNKHTQYTSLYDGDKSKIPYIGTDTLIFISNTNDTIKCIGTGKTTSQDCVDNGGSPECPLFTSTMCYENLIWNFSDIGKNFKINIKLSQPKWVNDYLKGVPSNYNLQININSSNDFYTFAYGISDTNVQNCLSTINFNGKDYYKVNYIYKDINDTAYKIFINNTKGIIRMEINNQQKIWNLK